MTISIKFSALFLAGLLIAACSDGQAPQNPQDADQAAVPAEISQDASTAPEALQQLSLEAVLAGDHRSDADRARDAYRHPQQTLEFLGLSPDMTVVEIWPGGGWYLEVIAPYLRLKGAYYAAGFDQDAQSDYVKGSIDRLNAKLAARADLYGHVVVTEMAAGKFEIAPAGSADMVLTFRNVHNWLDDGDFPAQAFAAMYLALKPGGVLGVIEHRGDPDKPQDPDDKSGYVTEKYVIDMAEAAGFQLADRSEINANPKDTKDYERGVWTLPPTLTRGDEDRDKYIAIGESDRMTLKFVRPIESGLAAVDAN